MITGKYKFNLKRSPVDPRDFLLGTVYPGAVDLPLVWDLRPQMQPVRDQGQEGSCSAETASEIKEWQEKVDQGYNGYMSPQFIYNLERAMDVLVRAKNRHYKQVATNRVSLELEKGKRNAISNTSI